MRRRPSDGRFCIADLLLFLGQKVMVSAINHHEVTQFLLGDFKIEVHFKRFGAS
jgi:hypothetical protein